MNTDSILVVGADSLVGKSLITALETLGHEVFGTTRRRDSTGQNRIYLDFEKPDSYRVPVRTSCAVIVAAATNYDRCATDPLASKINAELTPQLVGALLDQGMFVTLISTNSVFGGDRPWPSENATHDARIPYAMQKHEAENRSFAQAETLNALDRFSVVRLTKILSRQTSPLPAWFAAWNQEKPIEPFSDLIFAPLSVQFAGKALATLAAKRIPGSLHLSGSDNISYVDLAHSLAAAMRIDPALIQPCSAEEKGIHIAYKPAYSGLGMERTTRLSGVSPQPLQEVVRDLTQGE